jgi:PKD repeat protein
MLPPDIQPISQDLGISDSPKIAISGSNVYAVWRSDRAGIGVAGYEILFRRSTNYGITFEPVVSLLETDAEVRDLTIAASGSQVYVAWAERSCNPNWPPIVDFTFSPEKPQEGDVVTFKGSAEDPDEDEITSYQWDFGDGSESDEQETTEHTYSVAKTYTVKLTVTDGRGATSTTTQQIAVKKPSGNPNWPPIVNFTFSPGRPQEGDVVTFDGSAEDPDGDEITSYQWDFGDGGKSKAVKTGHTYATPGTYTVKLTVASKKGGKSTTTKEITIGSRWECSSYDIFVRRSTDGGASFDPPINLSRVLNFQFEDRQRPLRYQGLSDDIMPALATDNSSLYIVWASKSVGTFDIWFARWNLSILEEFIDPKLVFLLNLSRNYKPATIPLGMRGDAVQPTLVVDGSFVYVAWADNHPKPRTNFSIYTLSSSNRGTDFDRLRPKKMLQRGTRDQPIGDALCPALAARENEAFLAWSAKQGARSEIFFSSSTDGGSRFSKPVDISSGLKSVLGVSPGDSLCPALVAGRSSIYLSWPDSTPGNFEIIALANPAAPNPMLRLTNLSQSWGDSEQIALALDANERLYAVWMDKSSGKPEIYFRGRQRLLTSTAAARGSAPRPVAQLSVQGGKFVVEANSVDVARIELEVFGLHGRRVAQSWAEGQRLEFRPIAENGAPLANGVYLYVVTAHRRDGTVERSEVGKFVILR